LKTIGLLSCAPVWVAPAMEVNASVVARLKAKGADTVMTTHSGLILTVRRPLAEVLEALENARFDAWMETGDDRLQEGIET